MNQSYTHTLYQFKIRNSHYTRILRKTQTCFDFIKRYENSTSMICIPCMSDRKSVV